MLYRRSGHLDGYLDMAVWHVVALWRIVAMSRIMRYGVSWLLAAVATAVTGGRAWRAELSPKRSWKDVLVPGNATIFEPSLKCRKRKCEQIDQINNEHQCDPN